MATTFGDLREKVDNILGRTTTNRWSDNEIGIYIEDSIVSTSEDAPIGALGSLVDETSSTWTTGDTISFTSSALKPIGFSVAEASGNTLRWDKVDRSFLQSVREAEGDLAMTATDTRMWSITDSASDLNSITIVVYPEPANTTAYKLHYIKTPAISANMDLPTVPENLLEFVTWRAAALANAKKGYDLESSTYYWTLYNNKITELRNKYGSF